MRQSGAREGARELAAGQQGRISWAQLRASGLQDSQIRNWIRSGELTRTCPRVYSLGPVGTARASLDWQAVLYAGPGAYLTAGSGAHAMGLIDYPPRDGVVVATPRHVRSRDGIFVLAERRGGRILVAGGLPVATIAPLMLDLAATERFNVVRRALASLDYRNELDVAALTAACIKGRPGSRQLRRALQRRLPGLARCRSPLEVDFLLLCEDRRLPLPRVNAAYAREELDMFWPQLGLVVELDGWGNHHSAHQLRRDAVKDAKLTAGGLTVLRFSAADVRAQADATLMRLAAHGLTRP